MLSLVVDVAIPPRAGIELVLQVLRGKSVQLKDCLSEWQDAFRVAEEEHVLPFFTHNLRKYNTGQLIAVESLLAAAERRIALDGFWWRSELRGILSAFAVDGIAVIPLKGPILSQRVYGDPALRTCRDLDLLVQRKDFQRATKTLGHIGFLASSCPDDYHQPWRRGSSVVELHFNVENKLAFDVGVQSMWTRTIQSEFDGISVDLLAPEDEFLFLCLHGVRHQFQHLSQSMDIAMALRVSGTNPHQMLQQTPRELLSVLQLGLAMERRMSLREGPKPYRLAGIEETPLIESLANRLWDSLIASPKMEIDWFAQHRFYLELEPTILHRIARGLKQLRILATRLIEPDYLFASRFGVRCKIVVWILRQCRFILQLTESR